MFSNFSSAILLGFKHFLVLHIFSTFHIFLSSKVPVHIFQIYFTSIFAALFLSQKKNF